jgi:hypothetical protein
MAEGLHRAAAAPRFENYTGALLAVAQPAMPRGLTLLEQYYVDGDLTGIQAALSLPYGAFLECPAEVGSNADSLNDCGVLAEHMVTKGQTLVDLSVGIGIGKRSGWPTQRIAELKRERAALLMVAVDGPQDFSNPPSCEYTLRAMERVKRWSAVGEVPALRAELATSGLSTEDLAGQYDQWQTHELAKEKAAATTLRSAD